MIRLSAMLLFLTACGGAARARHGAAQDDRGVWPDGKAAAVSLTYDDGLDSQLARAVPVLDAAGLKGTFFFASMPGVDHE